MVLDELATIPAATIPLTPIDLAHLADSPWNSCTPPPSLVGHPARFVPTHKERWERARPTLSGANSVHRTNGQILGTPSVMSAPGHQPREGTQAVLSTLLWAGERPGRGVGQATGAFHPPWR